MRRRLPAVVLVIVVLGFLVLGLWQAWSDAPTYDEPIYEVAGVLAVNAHDVTFDDEHPILGKVLADVPVLLVNPVVPTGYGQMNEHAYAADFVQAQLRAGKLREVVFLSRIVPLLEAVAVGAILYILGCSLFGARAGLLAGVLWLADPFTMGLAHLDGIDVFMSLATVLLVWALLAALRNPGHRQLFLLGVASGVVILGNDDGLGVAAAAAVAIAGLGGPVLWKGAIARLVPVGVGAWATVAACYAAFSPRSILPYLIVPEPFLQGLHYLLSHDTRPSVGYLLGMSWTGGRWWYWPLSLAVKVPWATLAIMVFGPLAYLWVARPTRRLVLVAVVLPGTTLALELLATQRDIGARYALPLVAVGALVASPIGELARLRRAGGPTDGGPRGTGRRPAAWAAFRPALYGGVVPVLAAVSVVQTIGSSPHSLAWVNPGLGPSYQVASNSSQDWGQDFYALQHWAAGKDALVVYSGVGLSVADIRGARPLLVLREGHSVLSPRSDIKGWVAASASVLTAGGYPELSWLRGYCPLGQIDGTVLLYYFAGPPLLVPGPTLPAGPCTARSSHSYRPSTD